MKKYLLLVFSVLLLSSCNTIKIQEVESKVDPSVSTEVIAQAIRDAAVRRRWNVVKHENSVYTLHLKTRKHRLTIEVPYKKGSYRMIYKDSENLKYDADSQTAHKKVYQWMNKLKRDIDKTIWKVK